MTDRKTDEQHNEWNSWANFSAYTHSEIVCSESKSIAIIKISITIQIMGENNLCFPLKRKMFIVTTNNKKELHNLKFLCIA